MDSQIQEKLSKAIYAWQCGNGPDSEIKELWKDDDELKEIFCFETPLKRSQCIDISIFLSTIYFVEDSHYLRNECNLQEVFKHLVVACQIHKLDAVLLVGNVLSDWKIRSDNGELELLSLQLRSVFEDEENMILMNSFKRLTNSQD